MKIGLIGLGGFGGNAKIKAWKRVCEEGSHDLYVYDSSLSRMDEVGDNHQVLIDRRLSNAGDLISLVDAVDITTPAESHFEIAMQALNNRRHVFVEKPMTSSLREAEILKNNVEETGLVLQVGMHFRYNALTDRLKELIDNGTLGDLWEIEGRHIAGKRPRLDGGAILSCGIHFIDLILYLTEKTRSVKSVSAISRNFLPRPQQPNEDLSYAHISFQDGLLATIKSSVIDYATEIDAAVPGINANWDFMISGSKARAYVDYTGQKLFLDTGHHEWDKEKQTWKWITGERKQIPVETGNVYEAELRAFLEHIKKGEVPRANVYSSGVKLQKIIEAAYKSAEEGREVKV